MFKKNSQGRFLIHRIDERNTTMPYLYPRGTKRWRRHDGKSDVRSYRPCRDWEATAELLDVHPVTGRPLIDSPQWWIREVFAPHRPTHA